TAAFDDNVNNGQNGRPHHVARIDRNTAYGRDTAGTPGTLRAAADSARVGSPVGPHDDMAAKAGPAGRVGDRTADVARLYPAIQHLVSTTRDRVILTRITLLYVAKQALEACGLE